jgi:hypothetical protein
MDALVTTDWLAGAGHVLVLDATYTSTIPGSPPRDPRAEFEAEHIAGARYLDLDSLVDDTSPLPSTVPTVAMIAERLRTLGADTETPISALRQWPAPHVVPRLVGIAARRCRCRAARRRHGQVEGRGAAVRQRSARRRARQLRAAHAQIAGPHARPR